MMNMPVSVMKKRNVLMKVCNCCGNNNAIDNFASTTSIFYPDGYLPICNNCIEKLLKANDYNWEVVDKLCQYADLPFKPDEWIRAYETDPNNSFLIYSRLFKDQEYENIQWSKYYEHYKELIDCDLIERELPKISEERRLKLVNKWGKAYSDEDFDYLEQLLVGMMNTQNINGKLQNDQAKKVCKISLEIDKRIQEGTDFDKLLSSYDKLVKAAEFTPKNAKNINDLDSVGELYKWLEKKGYKCKFFDDVPRDIVDETLLNIESWNQRLYTNESGIGEEITRRIEALKTANRQENNYDLVDGKDTDLMNYEVEGYRDLMDETEEFDTEVE